MGKKKPLERWADSTHKTGYWMNTFSSEKYPMPVGVVWAKDKYWIFVAPRPGLDTPMWYREETWLAKYLVNREEALMGVGAMVWSSLNDSERAQVLHTSTGKADISAWYRAQALDVEARVISACFFLIDPDLPTNEKWAAARRWLRHATYRTDRPSPELEKT
jgi:hypothetical protein